MKTSLSSTPADIGAFHALLGVSFDEIGSRFLLVAVAIGLLVGLWFAAKDLPKQPDMSRARAHFLMVAACAIGAFMLHSGMGLSAEWSWVAFLTYASAGCAGLEFGFRTKDPE